MSSQSFAGCEKTWLPQVKTVMLEDDTFIVNKRRTERLADALIADGNTLPYDSNNRVDISVDYEFLKKYDDLVQDCFA